MVLEVVLAVGMAMVLVLALMEVVGIAMVVEVV